MDFGTAASQFCSVIERARATPKEEWLFDVERTLTALYAAARSLPDLDADARALRSTMSSVEWSALFGVLRSKFGSDDRYVGRVRGTRVEASIADDLADIYREVSSGLSAASSGISVEAVISMWRAGFDRWADHALGALSAIRELLKR